MQSVTPLRSSDRCPEIFTYPGSELDAPITARESLAVEAAAQATSSVLPPSLCRRARMPVGLVRLRTTITLFPTLSRRDVRPTEGPACPVPPSLPSRCPSFRCVSSCHPTRLHPPPRWTPQAPCVRHVKPDIPPTQVSTGRRLRPVPLPVPPPSLALILRARQTVLFRQAQPCRRPWWVTRRWCPVARALFVTWRGMTCSSTSSKTLARGGRRRILTASLGAPARRAVKTAPYSGVAAARGHAGWRGAAGAATGGVKSPSQHAGAVCGGFRPSMPLLLGGGGRSSKFVVCVGAAAAAR